MILPWGVIEWGLRLIVLLIEGIPPELRRASALSWYYAWWPIVKIGLNKEQREQIEKIMIDVTAAPGQ